MRGIPPAPRAEIVRSNVQQTNFYLPMSFDNFIKKQNTRIFIPCVLILAFNVNTPITLNQC